MNLQKGITFYLSWFLILSLILIPHGRVATFVQSFLNYFWEDTYFTKADWNLILVCVIAAFVIKLLKGGSHGKADGQ